MSDLTTKEALLERIVNALHTIVDKFDNYLPLSGGTMTGEIILSDGGSALSNATVGKVYNAAWKAESSAASGTDFTDSITNIPIGTYIAIIKIPVASANQVSTNLVVVGATSAMYVNQNIWNQTSGVNVIKVTNATNSIKLCAGGSVSYTFSNIDRGGLLLIRIA